MSNNVTGPRNLYLTLMATTAEPLELCIQNFAWR